MPYYAPENILFIHIPKTGGSSVGDYFYKKFTVHKSENSLFGGNLNGHVLHHCTLQEILDNKQELGVDFNSDLKIITTVRNPYKRMISELFFLGWIKKETTKEEVSEKIIEYFKISQSSLFCPFQNHSIPQYKFIENNEHLSSIVLKTESLDSDIKKIGYSDFDLKTGVTYGLRHESNVILSAHTERQSSTFEIDYFQLLNKNSIEVINHYHNIDFDYFKYEKL